MIKTIGINNWMDDLLILERVLHLHSYLENQVLHPRALAMEGAVQA